VNRLARIGWFALFALAFAGPAVAQGSGTSPADTPTGWIFRWLNFAIVAALIVYGLRKAGPYFRERREEIADRIAEGTLARQAAEDRRREVEEKLKGLDAEIGRIRRDAMAATESETRRLRAIAKDDAVKIELAAQAEIESAERAARLQLRLLAARMVVDQAEALLRKELTPAADAAFFRGFVQELQERPN